MPPPLVITPIMQLSMLVIAFKGPTGAYYRAKRDIRAMEQRIAGIEADNLATKTMGVAVPHEVQELIGLFGSIIDSLEMDCAIFALLMIKTHLAKLGVSSARIEIRRQIIDREDPGNAVEASLTLKRPS